MEKIDVVIMAGGEGSRLRPLTLTRPKPLVPVANRPIMWYALQAIRRLKNVDRIYVTVRYLGNQIVDDFGDGSDFGVTLDYSFENLPLGTAGSIKLLEKELNKDFLVLSGDVITDIDLDKLVSYHLKEDSVATLASVRVENPTEYGIVLTKEDGSIYRFLEKPSWSEIFSDTINAGLYVFSKDIFDFIPSGKEVDFSKDVFPQVLKQGLGIKAFISDSYWCDIGVPEQYTLVHNDMMEGMVKTGVPSKEIESKIWAEEDTEIKGKIIPPAILGRGVKIEEGAVVGPYSVIGPYTIIKRNAEIANSIVHESSTVTESVSVDCSIVGRNVVLMPRVVVNEGVIIGDRCKIGTGVEIKPGVKIWPDKFVEAGAVVQVNLIHGMLWQKGLFSNYGVRGLANIEMTPEYSMRMGAAVGTWLGVGKKALLGRDTLRISRMLKRSFGSGLLSTGVDVYDARSLPLPAVRFLTKNRSFDIGIYFQTFSETEESLIQIIDQSGFNIKRSEEKKLENILFKEELKRVSLNEVSDIFVPSRYGEIYLEEISSYVDLNQLSRLKKRIVVDCSWGASSSFTVDMLSKLSLEFIPINILVSDQAINLPSRSDIRVSDIVRNVNADIGFKLSQAGDSLKIYDENGEALSGEEAMFFMSNLVTASSKDKIIVPLSAPSSFIDYIRSLGIGLSIVSNEPRSLMEASSSSNISCALNESGQFIFSRDYPYPDGLLSLLKTLSMVKDYKEKISTIHSLPVLPKLAKAVVRVPLKSRGMIMRRLIVDFSENRTDTIDGMKVSTNDGYIYIRPSADEPFIHISAESSSFEKAKELVESITKIIQEINSIK